MTRRLALMLKACACAFAPTVHAAERGDTRFVVTYLCDGGTLSALETHRVLLTNCVES